MRTSWIRWLGVILLLVSGCGPTPKPSRRAYMTGQLTLGRGAGVVLRASTDCAERGEPITFTLSILNREAQPLELVGTPLVDMVITKHFTPSVVVARWSDSPDYPVITAIVEPNATHSYTWTWTSLEAVGTVSIGVDIQLRDSAGNLRTSNQTDTRILTTGVGETYAPVGGESMIARCSELEPEPRMNSAP